MLNYNTFQFTAKYTKTNRVRTRTIDAKNIEHAKSLISEQGYELPKTVIELSHDPPTDAQLSYARDLGIEVAIDDTKEDLIVLIDKKLSSDTQPNQGLIDYAEHIGMFFSLRIGKRRLYNTIYHFSEGEAKYAFFVFSVYRHLSNDRRSNLAIHPNKPLICQIARKAMKDEKVRKSMDRYAGEDLRFFGPLTADGWTYEGGSENTYAYKFVSQEVSGHFGTKKTRHVNLLSEQKDIDDTKIDKIVKLVVFAIVIMIFAVFAYIIA